MERTMELRPLSVQEAKAVYSRHLVAHFPPAEVKPFFAIRNRLQRGAYLCLGAWMAGEMAGYAFFASQPGEAGKTDYLLDYFAVLPPLRGRGLGSQMIGQMRQQLPNAGCVICEADDPDGARDAQEKAVREKRLRFYSRNGILETGVCAQVYGVDYRILDFHPDAGHTAHQIRRLYAAFYHSFFPDWLYEKKVFIH